MRGLGSMMQSVCKEASLLKEVLSVVFVQFKLVEFEEVLSSTLFEVKIKDCGDDGAAMVAMTMAQR
jgi:hypothetical protein